MAKEELKIKALETAVEELDAENTALKAALKEGKNTPSVKEALEVPQQTFKVGGRTFQFVCAAFMFHATNFTAKDALKNPDLLAELVEIEAGFLREIK